MLPALTAHLKAISLGLSVLLQTALARLLPCLWSAAPPDKLFHLPPPCHYERPTAVVPLLALLLLLLLLLFKAAMVCLSHFTLQFDSALWSLPYSGLAPAAQTLWIPQARRRPGRFFFFFWVGFVFSAVTKRRLLSASTVMTLKDTMANLGLGWFSYCPQAEIQYKAIWMCIIKYQNSLNTFQKAYNHYEG